MDKIYNFNMTRQVTLVDSFIMNSNICQKKFKVWRDADPAIACLTQDH